MQEKITHILLSQLPTIMVLLSGMTTMDESGWKVIKLHLNFCQFSSIIALIILTLLKIVKKSQTFELRIIIFSIRNSYTLWQILYISLHQIQRFSLANVKHPPHTPKKRQVLCSTNCGSGHMSKQWKTTVEITNHGR